MLIYQTIVHSPILHSCSLRCLFDIVEAKTRATQRCRQFVHLPADRLVNDASVDLRRCEFGMPEHLANRLNGHAIGIGYGRGECVAGQV